MINEKLIKVTNRCQVLTSRGMCIGPINYPYIEKITHILPMISKGAIVVEVLPCGGEVVLTKFNFDRDNTIVDESGVVREENPAEVREEVMMGVETIAVEAPAPKAQSTQNNNYQQNHKQKNFNHNNKNQGKKNNFNNNKPQQKPDVIINEKEVIHNNAPQKVKEDVVEEA